MYQLRPWRPRLPTSNPGGYRRGFQCLWSAPVRAPRAPRQTPLTVKSKAPDGYQKWYSLLVSQSLSLTAPLWGDQMDVNSYRWVIKTWIPPQSRYNSVFVRHVWYQDIYVTTPTTDKQTCISVTVSLWSSWKWSLTFIFFEHTADSPEGEMFVVHMLTDAIIAPRLPVRWFTTEKEFRAADEHVLMSPPTG